MSVFAKTFISTPPGFNKPAVIISDVPLPQDCVGPKNGIVALYGHRDGRAVIGRLFQEGYENQYNMSVVEMELDVPPNPRNYFDHTDIDQARFIQLNRISIELRQDITKDFSRRLKRSMGDPDFTSFIDLGSVRAKCSRLDVLSNAVQHLFPKVEAFHVSVPSGEGVAAIGVVVILKRTVVSAIRVRGDHSDLDVVLPDSLH